MVASVTVGSVQAGELEEVLTGMDAAFCPPEGPVRRQGFTDVLPFEPLTSLDYLRVVRVNNTPVAATIIVPLFLQVGKAIFKAAGLTGVSTWHGQRHKGYASILLDDVHAFLGERGFDIIILNSAASQLYLKHGYETSHQSFTLSLPWDGATRLAKTGQSEGTLEILPATLEDVETLHDIYNNNPVIRARQLQFLRTYARFCKRFTYFDHRGYRFWKVLDKNSKAIVAYAGETQDGFPEIFSATDDPNHYAAMIRHFVDNHAKEEHPARISLCPLPEHLNLIHLVQGYGGTFTEGAMSAKMSKILSVERVLQKLLPTFEWQLQATTAVPDCQFFLKIGLHSFQFQVNQSHIDIIESSTNDPAKIFALTPQELTMLLFGIAPVVEIIGDTELYRVDENRGRILEILFPPRKPFILPFNDY